MPSLSEAARHALLRLARQAVVKAVSQGSLPAQVPNEAVFAERHGIFVSLHVRHRLRGCIGVIEGEEPLGESTVRCAASAALQDPRFAPIRPEEIEIGRHGLLVSRGKQRGLLLPQVATEHRFTREQFLAETCRKAQLGREAWREGGTQVLGFTCEVFSDEETAAEP
jgi:AMMECR1 domain-containing protein